MGADARRSSSRESAWASWSRRSISSSWPKCRSRMPAPPPASINAMGQIGGAIGIAVIGTIFFGLIGSGAASERRKRAARSGRRTCRRSACRGHSCRSSPGASRPASSIAPNAKDLSAEPDSCQSGEAALTRNEESDPQSIAAIRASLAARGKEANQRNFIRGGRAHADLGDRARSAGVFALTFLLPPRPRSKAELDGSRRRQACRVMGDGSERPLEPRNLLRRTVIGGPARRRSSRRAGSPSRRFRLGAESGSCGCRLGPSSPIHRRGAFSVGSSLRNTWKPQRLAEGFPRRYRARGYSRNHSIAAGPRQAASPVNRTLMQRVWPAGTSNPDHCARERFTNTTEFDDARSIFGPDDVADERAAARCE